MFDIIRIRMFQFFEGFALRVYPLAAAKRVCAEGAAGQLPALLEAEGVKRPMLVTGPRIFAGGLAAPITDALDKSGVSCTVFSGVDTEPTEDMASAIAALYRQNGCDGMIALGGGSPMDAAKAALALCARPGCGVARFRGLLKIRRRLAPLIAVPTTAGTGSETTFAAVVTGPGGKYAITDPCLTPRLAVLDPLLTRSLPPEQTANAGMDALTHAVEAYLCVLTNTRDTYRLEESAVSAIFKHLPQAYAHGDDLDARAAMLTASFDAGAAFTRTGLGYAHAAAHAVGARYGIPHGRAVAVALPYVLEEYGEAAQKKLARLARLAGIDSPDEKTAAEGFIAAIRSLNARLGIEKSFPCILSEDVEKLARAAAAEADPVYPAPVMLAPGRCAALIRRIGGM